MHGFKTDILVSAQKVFSLLLIYDTLYKKLKESLRLRFRV